MFTDCIQSAGWALNAWVTLPLVQFSNGELKMVVKYWAVATGIVVLGEAHWDRFQHLSKHFEIYSTFIWSIASRPCLPEWCFSDWGKRKTHNNFEQSLNNGIQKEILLRGMLVSLITKCYCNKLSLCCFRFLSIRKLTVFLRSFFGLMITGTYVR